MVRSLGLELFSFIWDWADENTRKPFQPQPSNDPTIQILKTRHAPILPCEHERTGALRSVNRLEGADQEAGVVTFTI
jgi:hypothetical protein